MGNIKHTRYQHSTVSEWRLLKDNQRQLPCHPSIKVRVKVLIPGIQSRWCDRCQDWRYFTLEELGDEKFQDVLKLRWLTSREAELIVNALPHDDPAFDIASFT